MRKALGVLAVVAVLLGGCTDGTETGEPLPEGRVECPAAMTEQFPGIQCVAPEHAVRLGAGCSAHSDTCVLPRGGAAGPAGQQLYIPGGGSLDVSTQPDQVSGGSTR